jgi:hypothetical protein
MIEEANFEEDAHPAYTRILADLAPRRGADPEIPRRAGTAPLCGRAFRPPAAQVHQVLEAQPEVDTALKAAGHTRTVRPAST